MKSFLLFVPICLMIFFSCNNDDDSPKALFAVPQLKTLAEIRNGISVQSAKLTNSDGKIYIAENFLFYIAQEEGIHIFNNQIPQSPQNVAFINIPGVHDIAVKGNYLFADNYIDLVVFDISDLNHITQVQTLQNVITFYPEYPENAIYYDNSVTYDTQTQLITSYKLEYKNIPKDNIYVFEDFSASLGNSVGIGGSFAKFQIKNNALYTLDNFKINIFDISNPNQTQLHSNFYPNQWFGGQFETLFRQKEYLFIGSTLGMHIINISDEFSPTYVSTFSHATACDPVVVNGTTAYITIRSGNTCGAIQDQMNIIDISDIQHPNLLSATILDQPYGLAIRNDILYVCDNQGIKIFNVTNPSSVNLLHIINSEAKDIIALDSHLIAVGNQKVTQYQYGNNNTLIPISVLNF